MSAEKQKPKYNDGYILLQFLKMAAREEKSILIIGTALVLLTGAERILELLVSPMILSAIEEKAGLTRLLLTILVFTGGILITSSLKRYLDVNAVQGRRMLALKLLGKAGDKYITTSYENMLHKDFIDKSDAAINVVSWAECYAETIWIDFFDIGWNLLGLIFFGFVLGRYSLPLMAGILLLSGAGWLLREKMEFIRPDNNPMKEIQQHFRECWYMVNTMYDKEVGKDIRIFHMQEWILDIYHGILALMRDWYRRRETRWFILDLIDVTVSLLRNGIGYYLLIRSLLQGGISLPEFLLYTAAVGGFTAWVTGFLQGTYALHRTCFHLSSYFEFMDTPEPFRFQGGVPIPDPGAEGYEITLENVSYRYPENEQDTIHNLNLKIKPFEKLAVVGLNGAGKTTLINLILGLLDPTEGSVKLNGIDIRQFNRQDYYQLFSAVFQNLEGMNVPIKDNIAPIAGKYDPEKMDEAIRLSGIGDKIDQLPDGLNTYYGDLPEDLVDEVTRNKHLISSTRLSGGELQRLMLARALYRDGAVLALDEPTAALDPIAESEIYQAYHQIADHKTAVFISHRLASTRFCDRILYMENGQIAEEGTHEELLAKDGRYAQLFRVPSRYYQGEEEVNSDVF